VDPEAEFTVEQVADNAELVAARAVPLMIEDPPEQPMDVDAAEEMRDPSSSRSSSASSGEQPEHPAVRQPWTTRNFKTGSRRDRSRSSAAPRSRASSCSVPPLAHSSGSDKEPCEEDAVAHAKWKRKYRAAPDQVLDEREAAEPGTTYMPFPDPLADEMLAAHRQRTAEAEASLYAFSSLASPLQPREKARSSVNMDEMD
jgi:hypothetical protein